MGELENELKKAFLEEAVQIVESAEQCFVELERDGYTPTVMEELFRLAHNLKGSSKAVGFYHVSTLTHTLESVLLKVKNKELEVTEQIINVLLQCNDRLTKMINELTQDIDAQFENQDLIDALSQYLNGAVSVGGAAKPSSGRNEMSIEDLDKMFEEYHSKPEALVAPAAMTPTAQTEADEYAPLPTQSKVEQNLRVSLGKIERLLNDVGELVILQSVLDQMKGDSASSKLHKTITQLSKITKNIHDVSMGLRMVPIKQTFQKMQRIVRDTSLALGKSVNLILEGEETEIDKTILEKLGDPLVHLIRNACDHGIESKEARLEKGKPESGTIRLKAYHRSGNLMIEIRDDGNGLDAARVKAKAIERGLLPADKVLTEKEAQNLIFLPGFSTKTEVSDISGRGVGMDVVKTNIEQLKGDVQLDTVLGKGTCFTIRLPLTLSIIDAMTVVIDKERYVIPLSHVHESTQPTLNDIHTVTGMGDVFSLRGENLPLYRLSQLLGRKSNQVKPANESIAIVSRAAEQNFAVLVDDIIGRHQVVIKQLGLEHRRLKGFSGSTIMGDGRAALIVELPELVSQFKNVARRSAA